MVNILVLKRSRSFSPFPALCFSLQEEKNVGVKTPFTIRNLKASIFDMFLGGTESTAVTVNFGYLILIKHPELQGTMHGVLLIRVNASFFQVLLRYVVVHLLKANRLLTIQGKFYISLVNVMRLCWFSSWKRARENLVLFFFLNLLAHDWVSYAKSILTCSLS